MSDQLLTEEQDILRGTADRYLRDRYSFHDRHAIIASDKGFDPARWGDFAEFGWLGLILPERFGGSQASIQDLIVLMHAFGKHLVVEPYLSTVSMGALTLLNAGSERHCAELLPAVIEGRTQLALAFAERSHGYQVNEVATTARETTSGFVLNGSKAVVLGAPSADYLIVTARTSGQRRDEQGVSLFLVDPRQPGVALRNYPTVDGRRAAEVSLTDVAVSKENVIGEVGAGYAPLRQTMNAAILTLLGEALGVIDGCIERTVEYLNTREQFGVKLATFQVLRHRVADMRAWSDETSALVRRAAKVYDGTLAGNVREEVAGAKAYVGRYGMAICKEGVQLHGGMGVTEEYIVGHYLKRITVIDRLFGGTDDQIDVFLEESEALAI